MKKNLKILGVLVCVLALSMAFIGCGDGAGDGDEKTELEGTWEGTGAAASFTLTISGHNFTMKMGGVWYSGTFTENGTKIELTFEKTSADGSTWVEMPAAAVTALDSYKEQTYTLSSDGKTLTLPIGTFTKK
ncbi:hypothetical protein FACS189445_3030 [Spirochaetia bacterium]|nr:hypothetical protein FACS189445_3030 [Spirochaetia bacterium]